MAYSTTITALDLSGGVADVRVTAGYNFTELGPNGPIERTLDEVTLDLKANAFLSQSTPSTFSYVGDLAPTPKASWFVALWIQEVAGIPKGKGWLFRSGRFTTEPPAGPIEIILAQEQLIGAAELATAVGTLPIVSGSTTITGLTLNVVGADVALVAVGTDTRLPGVTFSYAATMKVIPNGSPEYVDTPFEIWLKNPSISFISGPGTGFTTVLLNAVGGIIENQVTPQVRTTLRAAINSGVLSGVATQLNLGMPASMPPGVVLSIRNVQARTRSTAAGTEPVIGIRGSLGAFGGVLNKFPALSGGSGGGTCFVASAASHPNAPEVVALRAWRDRWLRERRGGTFLIAGYERVSPPLARFVARSERRRALVRRLVVAPAARLVVRSERRR